jgi:hypothetical protein
MNARRRPPKHAREALEILAAHGLVGILDWSGPHLKVRWVLAGRPQMLVISRTPSDRRAAANNVSILRRLLREGGIA